MLMVATDHAAAISIVMTLPPSTDNPARYLGPGLHGLKYGPSPTAPSVLAPSCCPRTPDVRSPALSRPPYARRHSAPRRGASDAVRVLAREQPFNRNQAI